jgi:hypothetical protein
MWLAVMVNYFYLCRYIFIYVFWRQKSHYIAQAGLELVISSTHPGITGVYHHTWLQYLSYPCKCFRLYNGVTITYLQWIMSIKDLSCLHCSWLPASPTLLICSGERSLEFQWVPKQKMDTDIPGLWVTEWSWSLAWLSTQVVCKLQSRNYSLDKPLTL